MTTTTTSPSNGAGRPDRNVGFIVLCHALVLAATTVHAGERNPDKPVREKSLRAVQVSATLTPEDAAKVPGAVTVVDRADMAAAASTAIEQLRGATGAFVQQTTPGQSAVIVRGMKGSEVLHLVDGFRLNSTIFRNAPNQYFSLVDGQALERIELVRGANASLYGSDAMGGVVQMLTHAPESMFIDERGVRHQVRARYGSVDSQRLLHYQLHGGDATREFDVGMTRQKFGLRKTGDGTTQPFTGFESEAANARFAWRPAEAHTVVVNLQHVEQPLTYRFDELVAGYGQTQSASVTANFEPQKRDFAQFVHRYDAALPFADRIEWQVGAQTIVDDRRSRDRGAATEARESNSDRLRGVLGSAAKRLTDTHEVRYGFEYYNDRVRSAREHRHVVTGVVTGASPRFPDNARQDSGAVYVLSDWRPLARLDLVTGLRWNRFDLAIPDSAARAGVDLSDSAFTGQIGATWALADATRLVANAGRGFRAPNVFDVGQFGDRPGNRFAIPNPDLGPERVRSMDVGVKHASIRFEAEAYVWQSRFTDRITTVFTGDVTAGGRRVVQNVNLADARLQGVEAGARWFANDAWTFAAAINHTRGEEQLAPEAGYTAGDRIPPLNARISANWRSDDRWSFDAAMFGAARQDRLSERDLSDPRINPAGTAGFGRVDVGARYRVNDDLVIEARLENLGDTHYREHGSGIDAPGRNLLVGFDWGM
ncbi:MAG TPA: TonB-dependent receptor [Patescibacteria group bacterium]|nr:TonB-dependent receptor [Patescibacteria group bacterium]